MNLVPGRLTKLLLIGVACYLDFVVPLYGIATLVCIWVVAVGARNRIQFTDKGISIWPVWAAWFPGIFGPQTYTWSKIRRVRLYKSNQNGHVYKGVTKIVAFSFVFSICEIFSTDPHFDVALSRSLEFCGDRFKDVSKAWWRWLQ